MDTPAINHVISLIGQREPSDGEAAAAMIEAIGILKGFFVDVNRAANALENLATPVTHIANVPFFRTGN